MKLAVLTETAAGETRVSVVPDGVRTLGNLGFEVAVQSGAGERAFFADAAYEKAGATITTTATEALSGASVVVRVRPPSPAEAKQLPERCVLVATLDALRNADLLAQLAIGGVSAIAMELIPRITRAQSMDVLSSQATAAGYRAVLIAAAAAPRFFPMLMTAAGTIAPAKVLVLGAGVAGLQAIATARRLGAVVSAFDIRPAVKEQVESLGATFVGFQVSGAETAGGYAKEVSEAERQREHEHLAGLVRDADVVITTAQVPGRPAPRLITADMVEAMKPGAVIVDMAAESGGNVELTRAGEEVVANGVRIFGPVNLAAGLQTHASQMYSRNITTLLTHMVKDREIRVDLADEIVGSACVTHDGQVRATDGRPPIPIATAPQPA